MDTLYDEISDIAGFKYDGTITTREYRIKLAGYFYKFSDTEFEALSREIQDWVNQTNDAINKGSVRFPTLPGLKKPQKALRK